MPPHHHRSGQKAKKSHKRAKNAGPNQPSSAPLVTSKVRKTAEKNGRKTLSKKDAKKKSASTDSSLTASLLAGLTKNDGSDRPDSAAPVVIVFVALHDSANPMLLKRRCLEALEVKESFLPFAPSTVVLPPWAQPSSSTSEKRRLTLLDVPSRDKFVVLDACKTADVIIPCFGPYCTVEDRCIDDLGYDLLSALKNQGIPLVTGAILGFSGLNYESMVKELRLGEVAEVDRAGAARQHSKRAGETKKLIERFFDSEFGQNEKIYVCDSKDEVRHFLRALGNAVPRELSWRKDRGYLLVQKAELEESETNLVLSGYVRGCGFAPNGLVHVTNVGDFPVLKIKRETDPCPRRAVRESKRERKDREKNGGANQAEEQCFEALANKSAAERKEEMVRLLPYNPLQGEQTWPSQQEMTTTVVGFSGDDETMIPEAESNAIPESLLGPSLAEKMDNFEKEIDETSNWSIEDINEELFRFAEDGKKKEQMGFEERAHEDLEFPDEVDTPIDQPASQRFQRYRGLRSFKSSPWDAYEELPGSYARIWEYQGFKSCCNSLKMKHKVDVKLSCTGVMSSESKSKFGIDNPSYLGPGAYVSIVLGGVTSRHVELMKAQCRLEFTDGAQTVVLNGPLVASTLFETERKVSVMHLNLNRVTSATDIADDFLDRSIKSKTLVEFHCGFRKVVAKPIFSQLPKKSSADKDKHLFARYLHPRGVALASFFGPVVFAPTPVLMFELKGESDEDKLKDKSFGQVENFSKQTVRRDEWALYWEEQRRQKAQNLAQKKFKKTLGPDAVPVAMETDLVKETDEEQEIDASKTILNMKSTTEICAYSSYSHYNTPRNLKNLLAWGEVVDANPKRLLIKRAILTGYPFRIHRNKAVIRHMFFNPEDVRYFKPIELCSKHGLRGNIKESLGTHGIFKSIFSDRMKQHDTICLNLYKRQYPVWFPPTWNGKITDGPESEVVGEDC